MIRYFSAALLTWLVAVGAYGQATNQITTVSPASATQGTNGLTVTFALDTDSPPAPPAGIMPTSVTLGTMTGSSVTHASQYAITATFNISAAEPVGYKDAAIVFPGPSGNISFTKSAAFQVTAGAGVAADFSGSPTVGTPPLTVTFTNTSTGAITNQFWNFGDSTTSTNLNPTHIYSSVGSYPVSLTVFGAAGSNSVTRASYITVTTNTGASAIVDTGQTVCYNATTNIAAPAAGQPFYGQDAQCTGHQPSYSLSDDELTVYDNVTGLTWQRTPDTTGDGNITATDKLTWTQAQARPAALNAINYGGYGDWRLPTIKELYSLIMFYGTDPSGLEGSGTSGLIPFINTNYFKFAYGDTSAGERIIDSQYASSTLYVGDTSLLFGVNFADGRIKGYGLSLGGSDKTFFVQCVRGNPSYGINLFVDNGDQTITDKATDLMWSKADSGTGMNWSNALAWVQTKNAANYLGHSDWRLPNVKELQSIVDYTRYQPACDPIFTCTAIAGEDGATDYPWYWSGTTHASYNSNASSGAYVCFGRGWGYMNSTWVDIHGAGCQRSDPKSGSLSSYTYAPYGYYNSIAPQGDAVRLFNYVRLVRDYNPHADTVGDGIPDWWRAQYFGGDGKSTNATSCVTCDPDGDGFTNLQEYSADLNPMSAASWLAIISITQSNTDINLTWIGGSNAWQYLESTTTLSSNQWSAILTNAPPTQITNSVNHTGATTASNLFYRIKARR